jgi:DNA-binding MarR family transcriptional regulator
VRRHVERVRPLRLQALEETAAVTKHSHALLAADTGALLGATTRAVIALYTPHLAPLKLTHPQYLAMLTLADQEQHSVADIARQLLLTPATVSPLLARLEGLSYVQRVRDDTDARRLAVTLTATGIDLLPQLADIGEAVSKQTRIAFHDSETLQRFITQLMAATRDMSPGSTPDEPAEDDDVTPCPRECTTSGRHSASSER